MRRNVCPVETAHELEGRCDVPRLHKEDGATLGSRVGLEDDRSIASGMLPYGMQNLPNEMIKNQIMENQGIVSTEYSTCDAQYGLHTNGSVSRLHFYERYDLTIASQLRERQRLNARMCTIPSSSSHVQPNNESTVWFHNWICIYIVAQSSNNSRLVANTVSCLFVTSTTL